MYKNDSKHLEVILKGTTKILELTKDIKSAEALKKHEIANDAVILNFVSIMDSVKKLSNETKAELNSIKWSEFNHFEKEIADIRFTFNMDLGWELITTKLPALKIVLEKYLSK